jgi:hypothetical protein
MAEEVLGSTRVQYQGEEYDFGAPFARMTVKESILHFNPDLTAADLDDLGRARQVAERLDIHLKDSYGLGKVQIEIFEKTVEARLMHPTFITAYPTEVSPLARRNDHDPFVTDRFEFFVGGREIANGFSELNDPEDQAERFRKQVEEKAAGDEEAMLFDADYVRALEHAMPPTAGEGIGIDRLVMLFTDSPSIRDVLLFPHMRPVVFERDHDHGRFAFARNDDGRVVVADPFHGFGQVGARGGIADGVHVQAPRHVGTEKRTRMIGTHHSGVNASVFLCARPTQCDGRLSILSRG